MPNSADQILYLASTVFSLCMFQWRFTFEGVDGTLEPLPGRFTITMKYIRS